VIRDPKGEYGTLARLAFSYDIPTMLLNYFFDNGQTQAYGA
jgi:hypothetical protein